MKVYLVGGAVRDMIMGIKPKDKDYVITDFTEKDLKELENQGYKKIGNSFPVYIHPETKDEYALARKETKIAKGYSGFKIDIKDISLIEDLKRRDLTINAIAYDGKNFIDPFNGISDIKNKIFRNTSNKFREDPLRVLRLAKFKVRYPEFKIAESLYKEINHIKSKGDLQYLDNNRILKELKESSNYKNPSLFFRTLKDLNVLSEIFPNTGKLIGVPQREDYHPEGDAFEHTMLVYDQSYKEDLKIKIACLTHDDGKGFTPKEILPSHHGHERRSAKLSYDFCKRFNFKKEDSLFVARFAEHHIKIHNAFNLSPKKIVQLLNILKKDLNAYLKCAEFDNLGKLSSKYPQKDFLKDCQNIIKNVNRKEIAENFKNRRHLISPKTYEAQVSLLKSQIKNLKKKYGY